MKRVCIFSAQYFPTSSGGVERYTYNIAKALRKRGIEVTIVTSRLGDTPEYEKSEEGEIYRLPSVGLMNGRFPVVSLGKEYRSIRKKIAEKKYDLVITNTRFYPLSLVGARFGKENGYRNIVIEHGTSHMSVHNAVLDLGEQVFEHMITCLVKMYCKEFWGVSRACLEWQKHFHIKGKSVLYNSVDMEQIHMLRSISGNSFRKEHKIPEDALIIAFTGRLILEKGVLELLEAYESIRKKFPDTYLVYAGDGVLYTQIKEKKVPNVILLGQVSFEDVIQLLNVSEIFCLPSISEGMPTSVLEAIACENFVITTARGGAKEIIQDESYGIILPQNDTKLVEKALLKAVEDKDYRKKAIRKSYEELNCNFTWERVAEKIEKEFLH